MRLCLLAFRAAPWTDEADTGVETYELPESPGTGSSMRMTLSATLSASRSCASPGWLSESWPVAAPLAEAGPGALDLATTRAAKACVPRFPRRCCKLRTTGIGRASATLERVRDAATGRRSTTACLGTEEHCLAMVAAAPGHQDFDFGTDLACCLTAAAASFSLFTFFRASSSIHTCGSRISTGRTKRRTR